MSKRSGENSVNPEGLKEEILQLDRQVQRFLRAGWPSSWLNLNLPLGSTRALLVIEAGRATTPRRVAEVLGVGRTTVTGLLDRLEAEGLLLRAIDPADKRSFTLSLTPKGRELVEQIDRMRREQLERALLQLDPVALAALHHGLAALTEAMEAQAAQEQVKEPLVALAASGVGKD